MLQISKYKPGVLNHSQPTPALWAHTPCTQAITRKSTVPSTQAITHKSTAPRTQAIARKKKKEKRQDQQRPSSAKDTSSNICRWREGSLHLADGPAFGWLRVFTHKEWVQGRPPSPVLLDTASPASFVCMWPSFHGRTRSLMLTQWLSRPSPQWEICSVKFWMRYAWTSASSPLWSRWTANSWRQQRTPARVPESTSRPVVWGRAGMNAHILTLGCLTPPCAFTPPSLSTSNLPRKNKRSANSMKNVSWMWNEEHSHPWYSRQRVARLPQHFWNGWQTSMRHESHIRTHRRSTG